MKYKLIAADLDDTALHSDHTLSERLIKAIAAYRADGGRFMFATGRMLSGVIQFCKQAGLTGEVVTYQGALVADAATGQILEMTALDKDLTLEVALYCEKEGIYYQIYEGDTFVIKEKTAYSDVYAYYTNCEARIAGENLSDYIRKNKTESLKILIMDDPKNIPDRLAKMRDVFGERALVNTSKAWIIEVVNKDVDKGRAVAKIAAKYGIKREEVICIGDSMNDAPMLQWAGLGVAVGNATEAAKNVSQMIVPTNDEDGVAYVLENCEKL